MSVATRAVSRPGADSLPAATLAGALFALSFSAALFTLAIFKLLSFFIMPSLFFDLLFVGFPLGAFLAARRMTPGRRSLLQALGLLQLVMFASVAASLLAKRFDYLRAHLFDIELPLLIGQIAAFVGLFLPFFAAYGMCEYLAYQYGRGRLGGRMRPVYALALFGAAAAYVFLKLALPTLGMARIQLVAFLGVAAAMAALGAGSLPGRLALAEAGALALSLCFPGLERAFLALYKGTGYQSTHQFITELGCRTVYQRWGRYSLCEILEKPDRTEYYGFYNDMFQWEYAPRMGFTGPSLGAAPILGTAPGSSIAIIGAGGGRQVRLAERLGGRSVLAIELEPAVFDAVRSPEHLLRAFGRVYEAKGVRPVRAEARGYFERTYERFDLIYLPSVGGYAQMMIEPGNMIRTYEAHRLLRDHLSDAGTLAVWYPVGLDHLGVLTSQYVRTMRALGMPVAAYRNHYEWLILARRDARHAPPTAAEIAERMKLQADAPGAAELWPQPFDVPVDPAFRPITDDRPYLAGNVRYILSTRQVGILFALAGGVIALAGLAAALALHRRGDPGIPGRPFPHVALLALLIGANFVLIEHALVLALFRRTFVYDDALVQAVVLFLVLTGIGSLLGGAIPRAAALAAVLGPALLLAFPGWFGPFGAALALGPAALVTGGFFPALFDRAASNPLAVFALDAIGAGLGAVLATFVPLLGGFPVFFAVAAAVFVLTALADLRFHRDPTSAELATAAVPGT